MKEFNIKPIIDVLDKAIKDLEALRPEACEYCDGDGYNILSCCGDDIKGNDVDLCPSCFEHCGMEQEDCEYCDGTGFKGLESL